MDERNPSAFAAYGYDCGQVGMSLRDYFAGQALAAIIQAEAHSYGGPNQSGSDIVARDAYDYADAMLAERSKEYPSHD